jgi:hypothetical protein
VHWNVFEVFVELLRVRAFDNQVCLRAQKSVEGLGDEGKLGGGGQHFIVFFLMWNGLG